MRGVCSIRIVVRASVVVNISRVQIPFQIQIPFTNLYSKSRSKLGVGAHGGSAIWPMGAKTHNFAGFIYPLVLNSVLRSSVWVRSQHT